MAMAFPNDTDAEKFLPECPADVTDTLLKKQYSLFRKALLKTLVKVRPMLWPLGEQNARFVTNAFAVALKAFLKAKQAGPGKKLPVAVPQKAKPEPGKPTDEVTKVITVLPDPKAPTTEAQLTAEAGGKPNDGK